MLDSGVAGPVNVISWFDEPEDRICTSIVSRDPHGQFDCRRASGKASCVCDREEQ
jgi:hypothetical protein